MKKFNSCTGYWSVKLHESRGLPFPLNVVTFFILSCRILVPYVCSRSITILNNVVM